MEMKTRTGLSPGVAVVAAALATVGLATLSFARPPVYLGDFEDATLDAWGTDGGPGTPALSQGAPIGVTHGTGSLRSDNPQGSFWGPATGNLITSHRSDLQNATTLSLDLTLINAELNGGAPGFNGYAQSNELTVTLFSPNEGPGGGALNLFIQKQFSGLAGAGVSDSLGQAAGWNGVDGTRTIVWDLTKFTANDPNGGGFKSVAQFLAQYPGITDSKIAFVEQTGNGTATVGPTRFYFDNVFLNVIPEPGSLALIGLVAPMLASGRRQRGPRSA